MQNKKLLIKKRNILYTILILPFLQPLMFKEYKSIDDLYIILKIISSIDIILIFCFKFFKEKIKITKFTDITFLYLGILFISTILNKASINRCISYILPIFSLYLLEEIWIDYNMKDFLSIIGNILSIYIVINLITVIVSPMLDGFSETLMSKYFFLGEDNRFIFVILPLMCILGIYDYLYKNKISKKTKLVYLICLITLTYRWSVAAMVAILMLGLLNNLMIKHKNNLYKYFNIKYIYILLSLIYIAIVVFKLQYKLLDVFELMFNKRQTIESRYMLWEWCFNYISKKPILGYGIEEILVLKSKFLVNHCHNMFFQITYETGVLGLISYLLLFYELGKKIMNSKNKDIAKYSTIIIFIMLMLGMFDTLNHAYFFFMMFIIYKVLIRNEKNEIK